ncbi:MAG TPA: helicase-related protein, partial [Elusimicrobiales bacterium]|nr:helicase-related protein [Elusimicrobiales bacterium]
GIDVTGIEVVINYTLPDEDDAYVHRIGRTGRAGQPGLAITFATPDQGPDVRSIETLIKSKLNVVTHPEIQPAEFWDVRNTVATGRGWNQGAGRRRTFGGRRR